MLRALSDLSGCMGRFGDNHCRLPHLGWEQSEYGLSSRPGETADPRAIGPLLLLLGQPWLLILTFLLGPSNVDIAGSRLPGNVPHGLFL